jgi:hypothetical protein
MGKSSLLMVLAASVVISVMTLQFNKASEAAMENIIGYFDDVVARGLANQAMGSVLTNLADSTTLRVNTLKALSSSLFSISGSYSVYYQIKDTAITVDNKTKKAIKVSTIATYGSRTRTVVVYTDSVFGYVPVPVRGAFTADGPLNNTISDMQIDGRDHDANWNLISNAGVYGVSSGAEFTNTKSAIIGGTDTAGTDHAMKFPEDQAIIEENYNWGGKFPDSPDKALGYPDATLKAIAQSGADSSQYVTDPKNLKYPLRGVTYVELAAGVSWKGAKLGINPSGILIVHNSSLNARLENATTTNNTPFKGLIIADYMFHIHMDVLGALILLSPNLETSKECQGNANHKVFFSRETIKNATSIVQKKKGTGWRGRVPIIGWRE